MASINDYSSHFPLEPSVISKEVGEWQLATYTIEQQVDRHEFRVLYAGWVVDLRDRLNEYTERIVGKNLCFRFYPCKSKSEAKEEVRRLKVAFPKAKFAPDPD